MEGSCMDLIQTTKLIESLDFTEIKRFDYKSGNNSEMTDVFYRKQGLIIIVNIWQASKGLVVNGITFLSKIRNEGNNFKTINKLSESYYFSGTMPFHEWSILLQDNKLHSMSSIENLSNCISTILEVCDKDYNFDNEKHYTFSCNQYKNVGFFLS